LIPPAALYSQRGKKNCPAWQTHSFSIRWWLLEMVFLLFALAGQVSGEAVGWMWNCILGPCINNLDWDCCTIFFAISG
jgi:hypothetical protein